MKLPVGWRSAQLGDLPVRIRGGVSPVAEDRPPAPGEVGVLRLSALNGGRFKPEESKALLAGTPVAQDATLRAGTVLISRSNTADLVGATALVQRDFPDRILPDLIWSLDPERDVVDPAWLSLELTASAVRKQIQAAASGTSGSMKKLSMGRLRRVKLMVPPILEQREIAGTLGIWDSAGAKVEQLLAARRRLKRGLMQQLLTGKRRFRQFRDSQWLERRLGEIVEEIPRPVAWRADRDYDLLSIRRRSGGVFCRGRLAGERILTPQLFEARTGDFLISRMQVVHGAWGMVPPQCDGMTVSGSYIVLRPREPQTLEPAFLDFLSQLPPLRRAALLSSHGVHIEKMTFDPAWFMRTKITIPPTLQEQRKIVGVLVALDREIGQLSVLDGLLGRQKRGLMQQLLTGRLRVKV